MITKKEVVWFLILSTLVFVLPGIFAISFGAIVTLSPEELWMILLCLNCILACTLSACLLRIVPRLLLAGVLAGASSILLSVFLGFVILCYESQISELKLLLLVGAGLLSVICALLVTHIRNRPSQTGRLDRTLERRRS